MEKDTAKLMEMLTRAASDTLENLAFTEVGARPAAGFSQPPAMYRGARIELAGWGDLDLVIGCGLLEELASTLYSLEASDIDEACRGDALKEILNIIAGRFLADATGGSDFNLGLPAFHLDFGELGSLPLQCHLATPEAHELSLGLRRA